MQLHLMAELDIYQEEEARICQDRGLTIVTIATTVSAPVTGDQGRIVDLGFHLFRGMKLKHFQTSGEDDGR